MMAARIDKTECRALRAEGWTLDRLRARYGVSRPRVSMVCKGVVCPVDHIGRAGRELGARATEAAAVRKKRIRALYAAGQAPKVIAHSTGLSLSTVYIHLPPINSPLARKLREGGHSSPSEATACR